MADATVTRIGQINGAGAVDAIFLKVYAGEVLAAFEDASVMTGRQKERTISSGKSASFPVMSTIGSSYHTPGAEIVGKTMNHAEVVIPVDALLLSDAFLANIDEAMSHYEVRGEYSQKMGYELGLQYDTNSLRNVILAARATATVTGGNGGTALTAATFNTDASVLAGGIFDAAQALDEKNVPMGDRWAAFKPAQYYLLVQNTAVINRDWGGQGSYADGKVVKIADIPLLKCNHIPQADDSANANIPTAYRANYSTTVGAVWHKDATAVVKLLDLGMETQYDVRRQGTLMVAKYAVGHGVTRPECAVEFKTA